MLCRDNTGGVVLVVSEPPHRFRQKSRPFSSSLASVTAAGSHDEPPPLEPEIEDSLGSDWGAEDSDLSMDVDEEAIVQVMEVLALPRSAAIELLIQHDGNVETAIWNVLND